MMKFRCTSRYCGRLVPARDIEPEMSKEGWSFWCPFCHRESRLIDDRIPGHPMRLGLSETDEHGREIDNRYR